ncbi:MAG: acyltransferase [Clostridia bacterium]|nr:acyltransferase [Clostridia bacterium]
MINDINQQSNAQVMAIPVKKERQTGFEILRIIAMFLICCVHIMNAGGMLANASAESAIWQKLLYSVFIISVNVFVLISGYFMVTSKFKLKKIIYLWLEVLFYSVTMYLITSLAFEHNFSWSSLFWYCLPITSNNFWFFTAYFLLYLISPFLNKALNSSSKKELTILVIGILIFVYLATRFAIFEVAAIGAGYCILWFIILYILGAYLRLYPIKLPKIYAFIIYLACTLTLFVFSRITNDGFWLGLVYNSLDYTSPLVVIASMCAIIIFKDITLKNKIIHNAVCYISSCTFGIYLYHCSVFFSTLVFTILNLEQHYGSPYGALYVLLYALIIFIIGVMVDSVRKLAVWGINKAYKTAKEKRYAVRELPDDTIIK